MSNDINGGYDAGYCACPCFWGRAPGSLVFRLVELVGTDSIAHWIILDAGCGEGKNAAYFDSLGASVTASDISDAALRNAKAMWTNSQVQWVKADIRRLNLKSDMYDLVVAYGLLHCLTSEEEVATVVENLQLTTKPGGYNIICAFNDRSQDLSAHPDFHPLLLSHERYLSFYERWSLLEVTDADLEETHPHNLIPHSHSMTRFIARKPYG